MRKATIIILATVLACLLLGGAASAKVGFLGVGGKVGYVKPEDVDGTYGLGFFVNLGAIVPNLMLEGNADFWQKTYEECDELMGWDCENKCRDISIGGTARYMIPTQGSVMPFVGGGVAVHMLKCEWETKYPDYYDDYGYNGFLNGSDSGEDSETKIGFHGTAGVDFPVGTNVTAGGEVRYTVVEDWNNYGVFFRFGYNLVEF
jgi:opacity protein-like surface antigen